MTQDESPPPLLLTASSSHEQRNHTNTSQKKQEEVLRLEYETRPLIEHHASDLPEMRPRQNTTSTATHDGDEKAQTQKEDGAILRLEYETKPLIAQHAADPSATHPRRNRDSNMTVCDDGEQAQTQENDSAPLLLTNAPATSETPSKRSEAKRNIDREKEQQEISERIHQEEKLRRNKAAVVSAYSDFFNHISLRRGWKTVPFSLSGVKPLFEEAASIVVKIRSDLDKADGSFKIRQVDGSARDFMWSVKEDPSTCPKRSSDFVTQVVHATFQDNSGYVEGLTAERVQEEIDNF